MWWHNTTSQLLIATGSVEVKVNGELLITANIWIWTVITNSFIEVKKMMDKKLSGGKNEHKTREAVRPVLPDDWSWSTWTPKLTHCADWSVLNCKIIFAHLANSQHASVVLLWGGAIVEWSWHCYIDIAQSKSSGK